MAISLATTHHERTNQLDTIYRTGIEQEDYLPFGYPWGLYGALIVWFYFLIPHRTSPRLYGARWLVWGLNLVHAIYTIINTRAKGAVQAYAVGFGMGWSILWTSTMLLVYDAQTEFYRIERASPKFEKDMSLNSISNGKKIHSDEDSRRHIADIFIWQPLPTTSFLHRLDWVLDLMANFRGVTWNWRFPKLPAPPIRIHGKSKLLGDRRDRNSGVKTGIYATKAALLRSSLQRFIIGYILVDALKTLSLHDPFFWGFTDAQPPSYLPLQIRSSSTLTRAYRLILAELGIFLTIQTAMQLGPLLFVGVLGSNVIGVRGEHWVYPPEWGPFRSVFDGGLAGWWGQWWHQTFRFFFEAPGERFVHLCGLNPTSFVAKVVRLFMAFSLSGFVHGCASYTAIGETRPLRGAFLFFFLQPVGVLVQMALGYCFDSVGIAQRMPKLAMLIGNFVFVHVWFFYTAPLLVEDAARGGQFLWEPVPVSFARGLGFGSVDDSWWCWRGPLYSWHQGKYAWQSGIVS